MINTSAELPAPCHYQFFVIITRIIITKKKRNLDENVPTSYDRKRNVYHDLAKKGLDVYDVYDG